MPYYMYVSLQDDDKIVTLHHGCRDRKINPKGRGACRRWAVPTDDEPGPARCSTLGIALFQGYPAFGLTRTLER